MRCLECHQFSAKNDDPDAPDLTGYGSRKWLINFISDPAHPDFYGRRNDRMPAFANDQILTSREIELVSDWLRGQWFVPMESPQVVEPPIR